MAVSPMMDYDFSNDSFENSDFLLKIFEGSASLQSVLQNNQSQSTEALTGKAGTGPERFLLSRGEGRGGEGQGQGQGRPEAWVCIELYVILSDRKRGEGQRQQQQDGKPSEETRERGGAEEILRLRTFGGPPTWPKAISYFLSICWKQHNFL